MSTTASTTSLDTTRRTSLGRMRKGLAALVVAGALFGGVGLADGADAASAASTAPAARDVAQPGYICTNRTVTTGQVRVWASYGTQPVLWSVQVQRQNADGQWYVYSNNVFSASFDYYGRNQTGWARISGSGGYISGPNVNLPVYHSGIYRVRSTVVVGTPYIAAADNILRVSINGYPSNYLACTML
jgi:hypothetical protein